jgi:hypothetical protein
MKLDFSHCEEQSLRLQDMRTCKVTKTANTNVVST